MMESKIKLIIVFLIFQVQNSICQGVNNIWITGYENTAGPPWGNTVIDFASGNPVITAQNMNLSFRRTCATIADTSGNLLFYTNGFAVCNALGDTMPNGGGLDSSAAFSAWYDDGMPTPQGVIILPFPSFPDSFYLFHQTAYYISWPNLSTYASLELYYSIVDMNLDNGRGNIIAKEITFFQDTIQNGRITACRHANGRDWWLVTRKAYSDMFYTFLITPDGISQPLIQHIGQVLWPPDIGQVCFSPQGDKYALVDHFNHLRLFDFDRCTGIFSNPVYIPIPDSAIARGVAFAPGGRYLYVSSDTILYQFDTWAANIGSTKDTIATWDGFYSPSFPFATTFYTMQLGPDGKIYITPGNGTDRLHVINNPDNAGLACDVCQHCIVLPTYNSFGCIPNHPNYFLGAEVGSICDSLGIGINDIQSPHTIINIRPNPVNDYFWLDYDISHSTGNGKLIIYNTLGEVVLQKTIYNYFKTVKVDCNNLQDGIYYILLEQNNRKVGSGKFVRQ